MRFVGFVGAQPAGCSSASGSGRNCSPGCCVVAAVRGTAGALVVGVGAGLARRAGVATGVVVALAQRHPHFAPFGSAGAREQLGREC